MRRVLKVIHTTTVRNTVDSYGYNRALDAKPPDINDSEYESNIVTTALNPQLLSAKLSVQNQPVDIRHMPIVL